MAVRKPPKDPLARAGQRLLHEKHKELEENFEKTSKALTDAEVALAKMSLRLNAHELSFESMLRAISVLAGGVPSTTTEGRKLRDEARSFLTSCGVRPPRSLGSPRKVKKRKKVRKTVKKPQEDSWSKANADDRFQEMLKDR